MTDGVADGNLGVADGNLGVAEGIMRTGPSALGGHDARHSCTVDAYFPHEEPLG